MPLIHCSHNEAHKDQVVCQWTAFCGNYSSYNDFWNYNLSTFAKNDPDFTLCFQHTILTWWPCGFLLLATPLYLVSLSKQPTKHPWSGLSALNWIKTILCLGKVLTSLLIVIFLALSVNQPLNSPAEYVASVLKLVTYILATWLTPWEFRKGAHSSAVMFLFWLFMMICDILQLRSNILRREKITINTQDIVSYNDYFYTYNVYFVLLAVQFALAFVPDEAARIRHRPPARYGERAPLLINQDEEEDEEETNLAPCPELSSPFWARMTFWWFTPTVVRGYFRSYTFEDLPDLRPADKVKTLYPGFNRVLYGLAHDDPGYEVSGKPKRSVLCALLRQVGYLNVLALIIRLVTMAFTVVGPLLLQVLMRWVDTKEDGENPWKGMFLAAMLFLSAFMTSVLMHRFLHVCYSGGMQMRTLLNIAVYRKLLKLSAAARQEVQGSITNLVATDAQRIQDCMGYMTLIFTVPVLVVVVIALLWQEVQEASLAGLAVLIIIIPLNSMYLSRIIRNLQVKQMDDKDERIGLTNEIMKGIKILKLYAWEIPFHKKILEDREKELDSIKKINYINAFGGMCWLLTPFLVSLAMFATYVYLPQKDGEPHVLDSSKAFVSWALINLLSFPLSMLPQGVSASIQAWVSVQRIGEFMLLEELDDSAVIKDKTLGYTAIKIDNCDFKWSQNGREDLRNINMTVPRGGLIAVVGSVGSGKTSLISAMLGELHKSKGSARINGSLAYVPQQAWIQLATLKDNILFGSPLNNTTYNNIVDACALRDDLQQLPMGDQTEIGERGINLSGGQKQQVSIARAVYQDEDIYLLDDPLSALDAHVGKHIFDNVIGRHGLLHDKTRVLVTHGITFLPHVDHIVVLDGGIITEQGSYEDLLEQNGDFAEFIRTFLLEEGDSGAASEADSKEIDRLRTQLTPQLSREDLHTIGQMREVEMLEVEAFNKRRSDPWRHSLPAHMNTAPFSALLSTSIARRPRPRSHHSHTLDTILAVKSDYVTGPHSVVRKRRPQSLHSRMSTIDPTAPIQVMMSTEPEEAEPEEAGSRDGRLVAAETSEKGMIRLGVMKNYIKAGGVVTLVITMVAHVLLIVAQIGAQLWLSEAWTNPNATDPCVKNLQDNSTQLKCHVTVYGIFGIIQVVVALVEGLAVAYGSYAAARIFHQNILERILHAPMAFFDTTPLGRILNRFSKDVDALDTNMPVLVRQWLFSVVPVFVTLILVAVLNPIFIGPLIVILVVFIIAQRFYTTTVRQLKRIDNVKRSPLLNHFNESTAGVASIRAYGRQREFMIKCDQLVDESQRAWFLIIVSQRWCGMTMETLGAFVVFFSAYLGVTKGLSSNLIGVAVSQALSVTTYLNALIRNSTDLETYVVSAERIDEYTKVAQEKPWDIPESRPTRSWPSAGRIHFQNYATRYRPGLDLVLQDLNCQIQPGEMVGIVGRTGAGKSSLSLALFRIIEAARGRILIDGINVASMGLHSLRSKITVIPQDPVVFSGSLRRNLDPFNEYSDQDVWTALEHAHLKAFVQGLHEGLNYECGADGDALSVGQRQLLCLARALLRKTKILVLDEATAGVDLETDALVQKTIRKEFAGCTVLTVAHRLNTVMDYDKIMVLDKGSVKEFDSPSKLLGDSSSMFSQMAAKANIAKQGAGSSGRGRPSAGPRDASDPTVLYDRLHQQEQGDDSSDSLGES